MSDNLLEKLDKIQSGSWSDLIFGKDEDIFVRNARRKEINNEYGSMYKVGIIPGWFAYVSIKKVLENSEFTIKQKTALCSYAIGGELFLDGVKTGIVYIFYKTFPLF